MKRPFIMAAPNGVRRTKADHPAVPVSIPETVETAVACCSAGADALHLHVRDAQGGHSLDTGLYREAMAELERALPGLPVQVTTESGGIYEVPEQLALVEDLQPRWISLALREAARDPELADRLYAAAAGMGTEIQHIVFDADDSALLKHLQGRGVIAEDCSVILVLGRYSLDMNSDPDDLPPLLLALPPVGKWMLCAFGPNEHASLLKAISMGGDVRIGFENSFLQPDGTPWPDNPSSVAALVAALDRPEV